MFNLTKKNKFRNGTIFLIWLMLFSSCASMDVRKVDVKIKKEPPQTKTTSFTKALTDLGNMSEIYGSPELKIQSKDIADNTGTSISTGAEVPRDITEMLKSTLNAIGGKVLYIPYNPSFIQNQMVTGYSNFDNKIIPDVVVTGGITEFDRGLETRGSNTDVGASVDLTGSPKWVPSTTVGADYSAGEKFGLASITLDFNLIDFKTMSGVSRMQTVNSIKVRKAVNEKELAITLFGPTFGLKGSIKKVQGRHAAVRLLVQLSMIQLVGKYMMLPYWKLLTGAGPDPVVMERLKKDFFQMPETDRIVKAQEMLFIEGYDVSISGELDEATIAGLKEKNPSFDPGAGTIDKDTFFALYLSVPITDETMERRIALNKAYAEAGIQTDGNAQEAPQQQAEAPAAEAAPPPQSQAQQASEAQPDDSPQQASPPPQQQAAPAAAANGVGGRMLKDDEW